MDDLITISSSALPRSTRVIGFRGVEALSRPYEIEIFLALREREGEVIALADAIGAKAALTVDHARDAMPPFILAGLFASIELLQELDGQTLFRAVLVPRLWQLGLSRRSRIFTKVTLPEVIEAVLEDNGIGPDTYALRLGAYETEEHICQYRESDLDFLARWMEREGIFYFFEHSAEGEKLIFCDAKTLDEDPAARPVRYHPQLGHDRSAGASLRTFTCRHTTLPSAVKLKDYDYARPNLSLTGAAPVAANGAGEVSLHNERFFTPKAGARLARIRAEELLARQVVFRGAGTRLHLRPGYTFELEDHPREAFNTRYLTTEAHHHGNQGAGSTALRDLLGLEHEEVYFVEVTALPAATQFRAESRTPWPRIYGYENGTVDGAADSEYAQIDEQGRYNVKFKFDESDLGGGKASTFVRMMQPHGGGIEGFHFPLRKGTEVVLSFLGGDPDRPVISGVVPNLLTPSPVTSGNHTKNVIQTGGRNRLELEDQAGQQRITLSTPHTNTYLRMGSPNDDHTMILHTDGPTLLDAGKDWDVTVGGHLDERVEGPTYEEYHGTRTTKVSQAAEELWGNNLSSYVTGTTKQTFQGAHEIYSWNKRHDEVGGNLKQVYHGPVDRRLLTTLRESIMGWVRQEWGPTYRRVRGSLEETVDAEHTITTGPRTEHVKGDYLQNIDGTFTQNTIESKFFFKGPKSTCTMGPSYSVTIGGKTSFDASASVSLVAGAKLEAKASTSLSMTFGCDINVKSYTFNQDAVRWDSKGVGIQNVGTAINLARITIYP